MVRLASPSGSMARMRILPPQVSQTRRATANTRLRRSAQLSRRREGGLLGTGRRRNSRAKMVVGREDTMIAGEMTARWWNERRKTMQEVDRRERERGATVAQGTLEGDDDAPRRI